VGFNDYWNYLVTCLVLSAVLVPVAIWRLRPVAIRQASRPAKAQVPRGAYVHRTRRIPLWRARTRWHAWLWREWQLDANPVLWREWEARQPSLWSRIIWRIYALLAVCFSFHGLIESWGAGPGMADYAAVVIAFQVVTGLLLVSVAAPCSVGEERARGTLETLLTTPLSTTTILWAKWRVTYRIVLRLVILPWLLLAAIAVGHAGRHLEGTLVLAALILAYGAAVTSLGLALATWTSRLGRAVTWNVIAYVAMSLGSMFFAMAALGPNQVAQGLAMGSPFFGTGYLSAMIMLERTDEYNNAASWGLGWIAFYSALATILYLATLATFDRYVGRMNNQMKRRARRPKAPAPAAVPVA
jgi:ABC-type transport system involved in multi-copper enzyme maturation permease subunit